MDQQAPAQPAPQAATPAPAPEAAAAAAPATSPAPVTPPPAGTTPPAPTGTPAPGAKPAAPGQSAPAKKSPMKAIIILLIFFVLVGAGIAAYQMFMVKGSSMNKNAQVTPAPSPAATAPSPTVGPVKSGDSQVDQQSDAVDSSMDKLNNDVKGVDTSLQDKSVDLNQ